MTYATPAPIRWVLVLPGFVFSIRLTLAAPFLQSGVAKALDFSAAKAEIEGFGLPAPAIVAVTVIATQLVGACLLLSRHRCWLGAGMLSVFTVLATLLAHAFWAVDGLERTHQAATFFEHIAIIGGLAAAVVLVDRESRR